jgi:hypothetical protein
MNTMDRGKFVRLTGASVLAVALIAVVWAGCSKDSDPPAGPGTGGSQTATIRGVVKDADSVQDARVAGASVSVAGIPSTTTNSRGEFTLAVPSGVRHTVRITKNGYSLNELVLTLTTGSVQNVTIGLLRTGTSAPVSVAAGGTVADEGYTLAVPPGFVNATGSVTVSVTGLDPTTEQVRALPGGLEAVDAQGNTRYLQPVSFAEYVIRDQNGNVLQVNPSASQGADIELPIPQALRGQPGYAMGDPIECYVYDPADGKWKSPVPGVIGAGSVDGSPVIKATIFHLSWYGGAPAKNERACIEGYVKDKDGKPLAGVDVEAFTGGAAKTDALGFYQVDAAPGTIVRVVATIVENDSVFTGEVSVLTLENSDVCVQAADIKITKRKKAFYRVSAYLFHTEGEGEPVDEAVISIAIDTDEGPVAYSGAAVTMQGGGGQVNIPSVADGYYAVSTPDLMPPFEGGQFRDLTFDFDGDGSTDASGSVQLPGSIEIIDPVEGLPVQPRFTARWTDSGTEANPYSARYYLTVSSDTVTFFTITEGLEFEIGDGSIDTSFGFPLVNSPLLPGDHTIDIMGLNGTLWTLGTNEGLPNITGENATGYISAFSIGASRDITVEGLAKTAVRGTGDRRGSAGRPPALRGSTPAPRGSDPRSWIAAARSKR